MGESRDLPKKSVHTSPESLRYSEEWAKRTEEFVKKAVCILKQLDGDKMDAPKN